MSIKRGQILKNSHLSRKRLYVVKPSIHLTSILFVCCFPSRVVNNGIVQFVSVCANLLVNVMFSRYGEHGRRNYMFTYRDPSVIIELNDTILRQCAQDFAIKAPGVLIVRKKDLD